jgi:nitroreductase
VEISDLLRGHRSIRSYRSDPIPDELVEDVLAEAVAGGSSSGNLNSATVILTRDEERKKRLFELHFQQEMVNQAPLVVTFCADWYRTRRWLKMRGARDNFNNLLGYHVALGDAWIVAQNAVLGFQNRGLGICYMGTTLYSMREISELLNLPETCLPITTIVVGYPAEDPKKRDRLPMKGLVFEESYPVLSDEEIAEAYREREVRGWERYMAIPELRKLAEEHGITELAQFYTSEIKYSPDYFGPKSAELANLLEEKGFLP